MSDCKKKIDSLVKNSSVKSTDPQTSKRIQMVSSSNLMTLAKENEVLREENGDLKQKCEELMEFMKQREAEYKEMKNKVNLLGISGYKTVHFILSNILK